MVFVAFACAAILGVGGISVYYSYVFFYRKTEKELVNLSYVMTRNAEDAIGLADNNLSIISRAVEMGMRPAEAVSLIARTAQEERTDAYQIKYAVTDRPPKGRAPIDGAGPEAPDAGDGVRAKADPRRKVVIGRPVFDSGTGQYVIPVARSIFDRNGALTATASASIDIISLVRFFAEAADSRRMTLSLARDDFTLLARYPVDGQLAGRKLTDVEDVPRDIDMPGGIVRPALSTDGIDRLSAYRHGRRFGLIASVSITVSDIANEWMRSLIVPGLMCLATMFATAALGLWGMRQVNHQAKGTALLAKREAEFRMLAEGAHDPILLIDAAGVIRYASPAALVLFECPPDELVGLHIAQLANAEDAGAILAAIDSPNPALGSGSRIPFRYQSVVHGQRWYVMAIQAVAQDSEQSYVISVRDETEERIQKQALIAEATTDKLSGLANRHQFDRAFEQEWKRMREEGGIISVIMVDADRFKAYNDTYGHSRGDMCISAVARSLRDVTRRSGEMAARFGGEEFIVLLPRCDLPRALEVAERIRLSVEAKLMPHRMNRPFGVVTVSLGVASVRLGLDSALSAASLVETADKALYNSKNAGRNQVSAINMNYDVVERGRAIA